MKLILGVLLGGALAACSAAAGPGATSSVSLLLDAPHIELRTLDQLFDSAGSYLQTSGELEVIAFRCTVVEGAFCWFGATTQDGAVAAELARRVVDQIGPKAIENANRNEVAVRCYRPVSGGGPHCEVDWGWRAGWEGLAIRPP